MNTQIEKILVELADGSEYESEYDGINDSYCSFCNQNMSHNDKHDSDCLMIQARDILGNRYEEIVKQRKEAQEREYKNSIAYQHSRQSCPVCNKLIMVAAMDKHQRDNKRCNKIRSSQYQQCSDTLTN
jgi:hypothetical protein